MSRDLIKVKGFILKKAWSRWLPAETMTGADYIDDLALLAYYNKIQPPNQNPYGHWPLYDQKYEQSSSALNKKELFPL